MFKIIRTSREEVVEWNIQVYVTLDGSSEMVVAASESWLDSRSKADWRNFIDNVLSILHQHQFETVDQHKSNRKHSLSYYISFYPVDLQGKLLPKHLVNFRLSDHDLPNLDRRSHIYYERLAELNRRDFSNSYQRYRLYSIIVNEEEFLYYRDALDYVEELCDQLQLG